MFVNIHGRKIEIPDHGIYVLAERDSINGYTDCSRHRVGDWWVTICRGGRNNLLNSEHKSKRSPVTVSYTKSKYEWSDTYTRLDTAVRGVRSWFRALKIDMLVVPIIAFEAPEPIHASDRDWDFVSINYYDPADVKRCGIRRRKNG